jgi:CBS domain-containing protein
VLTRNDLAAALGRHGPEIRVGDVMQHEFCTTEPREMLQTAFARLQDGHCRTLPVVEDGRLLGLLTADNLAEVLMIQEALREKRPTHPRPDRAGDLPLHELPLRHTGATSFDGLHQADTT